MKKRSHRYEKMARVYDDEILPIWSQRFGRMMLRGLELPDKAMVLDVGCGTGYPTFEILKRLDSQGRIIALDPIGPLLDVARKKAGDLAGKRIFFRSEPAVAKLAFADEVYHLVLSNLGLLLLDDPPLAIKEFTRVTRPQGQVILTLPLAGTYEEFFDIYREVLTKSEKSEILQRLEQHVASLPDAEEVVGWMESAGLENVQVEVEQFSLLFKSSREFFFAPVIEYGPLKSWKDIAGKGQEMQEIFWHIKEAIDAYFGNRAFEVTVQAGCLRGIKPAAMAEEPTATRLQASLDERTASVPGVTVPIAAAEEGSQPLRDDFQLDEEDEDTTDS